MSLLKVFQGARFEKIILPVGNENSVTASGRIEAISDEFLEVEIFHAHALVEFLDLNRSCYISYQDGNKVVALRGEIMEISSSQKLHLRVVKVKSREQMREYYRINTRVDLRYWRAGEDKKSRAWQRNIMVNLGGGGIKFSTTGSIGLNEKVGLEIYLPGSSPCKVRCGGVVKRVLDLSNGQSSLAFQFIGIKPQDRENIIRFCFACQLEQLRNKSLVPHCDNYLLEELGF